MKLASQSPQELFNLIAQGKGTDLHWFQEDVSLSQLAATLVALANTSGGIVLLGVSPRSGKIHGISNVSAILDEIFQAALLADPPLILPFPKIQEVNGLQVIWITVPTGLPHVYSMEGRYLCRQAAQNEPLPPRQLRRLLLERGAVQFEAQIPPGVSLNDLDLDQVNKYVDRLQIGNPVDAGSRLDRPVEILFQRGCLRAESGELRPTYAAILLFGCHPQRYLPAATILAARFPFTKFGDRYIKQDIAGTLPEQLFKTELFVRDHLRSVVRMRGLRHRESLEYPFEAIRELLVNAVAHRDYNLQGDCIHLNIFSDRLEVSSPGGLPGPINLNNLLEARFSRNAVIMQVLSDLGFVERLGYGLERVVNLMVANGLQRPIFEERAGTFKVTLLAELAIESPPREFSEYLALDLNPRQQRALNYLAKHKRITNSEYQQLCPDVHAETLGATWLIL